eukprot:GHVO01044084.1.p1 GENE.GHVO01044084.1~~GHVO01044084.1.p1  ORF type:complete len:254 (+),score=40.06 GHVO01044084.1:584-1345(+)
MGSNGANLTDWKIGMILNKHEDDTISIRDWSQNNVYEENYQDMLQLHVHKDVSPQADVENEVLGTVKIPKGVDKDEYISEMLEDTRAGIKRQIAFYFSEINYKYDSFLRSHEDSGGWIPIRLIAGFNKMKSLTHNIDFIRKSISDLEIIEISPMGDTIRRKKLPKVKKGMPTADAAEPTAQDDPSQSANDATAGASQSANDATTAQEGASQSPNCASDVAPTYSPPTWARTLMSMISDKKSNIEDGDASAPQE